METVWRLPYERDRALPAAIDSDVRMPPALAERLVRRFTDPGETVLDPFAGFGTTLRVATGCDRRAYGVEYEPDLVEYVEDEITVDGRVIHGDSRRLADYDLPQCEAVVTSPPFMTADMDQDPLQNYAGQSDYDSYLEGMAEIFEHVRDRLAPGGTAALNVSNMKYAGAVTPLAWDLADAIRDVLHFEGEIVVAWDPGEDRSHTTDGPAGNFGYGYDHSYVLVFSKPE